MSLTASNLIDNAKKRTFGAVGRQKTSDAQLLAELSYQDEEITKLFSQIAPDLLATVDEEITITLAGNKAGYTLQAGIHYRDFTHVDGTDDEYEPITLVQRQYRENPPRNPAGMLNVSGDTGVFYPIDPEGDHWQSAGDRTWFEENDGHTVEYSYVPAPGQLTTLSATLTSPDMARSYLEKAVEVAILLASPEAPQARLETALAQLTAAETRLRWQAYKFAHPAGGQPVGGRRERTDSDWVLDQVGG